MNLYARFRFNKAGQGCFYTGDIELKGKHFLFAYDCGVEKKSSKKYLNSEIDGFKQKINRNGNRLDLLIISHFDYDHVSGVKKLLEGIKCDNVIIPYITPTQRLSLYAGSDDFDATDDTTFNYDEFLKNPIGFFSDLGVNMISVIGGEGDNTNNNLFTDEPPPTDSPQRGMLDKLSLEFGNIQEWEISEKIKNEFEESFSETKSKKTNARMYYYSHFGYIRLFHYWWFKFFCVKQDENKVEEFQREAKRIFNIKTAGISQADIFLIFKGGRTKALKDLYKKYFSDSNFTSLMLYHAPIKEFNHCFFGSNISPYYFLHSFDRNFRYHYFPFHQTACGTLLTGDIQLQNTPGKNFFDEIESHFKSQFEKTLVFQVPHHGSNDDWNPEVVDLLNNWLTYYVINFGLGNTYKHPSGKVIDDLTDKGCHMVLCNQLNEFEYRFRFHL